MGQPQIFQTHSLDCALNSKNLFNHIDIPATANEGRNSGAEQSDVPSSRMLDLLS